MDYSSFAGLEARAIKYVDPNARPMNVIGINSEKIFGVSPELVGSRLASGWSSAATTQYSTFTTSTFLLDEAIGIPFGRSGCHSHDFMPPSSEVTRMQVILAKR